MRNDVRPAPGEAPSPDALMPRFDVETVHGTNVRAPPGTVYREVRTLDMSKSLVIRALFRLRGIPRAGLTAEGLRRIGFKPVLEVPDRAFALGIVGRFWTVSGLLADFDPATFRDLATPGYAKAIWYFEITPTGAGGSELRTVTRVHCPDDLTRRRFRRYWSLVAPFSGLVRSRALTLVRKRAEERARRER